MNTKKRLCIVGTGGFARETLVCLLDGQRKLNLKIEELACFMEEDKYLTEKNIMGIEVIPQSVFSPEFYDVVVAIGDPIKRKRVVETLPPETTYAKIVHPSAIISKWVEIGDDAIITSGVIITCNIKIGKHSQLNLHTTIGHDCIIGDYFTTAPGAKISGNCNFGDNVYLGTNSSVRQGISICDDVTIGMGGVVVKDIYESGVYVGNPLRKIR